MQVLEINRSGISLGIEKGFIRVSGEGFEEKYPVDLIDCIILSSYGAKISNRLLIRLCELCIPMIICGSNNIPVGIMNSVQQNVYRKSRVESQISASQSFKDRLWQSIVRAKIRNQALLLKFNNKPYKTFDSIARNVCIGDNTNCEAQAARLYWPRLFGPKFRRNPDLEGINSSLNYAYAILRASFCRQITAKGLLPELGIHHRNKMNPFCLADDLMEPFRPFADKIVFEMNELGSSGLSPSEKKTIISKMDSIISYKEKKQHLQNCIALYVQDLVDSYADKKNKLQFPETPIEWVQTDVDDGDV